MSFSDGHCDHNAGETRDYRQTFLTLPGSNDVNGSIDGSVRISYDSKSNITAYRWNGSFQYSIPGDQNRPQPGRPWHVLREAQRQKKPSPDGGLLIANVKLMIGNCGSARLFFN